MAETPGSEPVPSSSEPQIVVASDVKEDDEGPAPKKRRISDKDLSDKLEHRLGGILCCAVCLDLPLAAVYQCSNGHLMCAPCFTHLLADARLRDEAATCPNCRVEISKNSASRNLAVEKTVSELPSECKFCTKVFPRHSLQHHETEICEERRYKFAQTVVESKRSYVASLVRIVWELCALLLATLQPRVSPLKRPRTTRLTECKYSCIGCGWRGPAHEAHAHEAACTHPHKSAADVLAVLAAAQRRAAESAAPYGLIWDLLSYEKITFTDLQLKPYRTEESVHRLYFESSRFSAFTHQWVVKAFVNKNQGDPTQSASREITYQLILKSKTLCPQALQWMWLQGPYGETRVRARVCAHVFRDDASAAPALPLPLADRADTNRLLSNKAVHFRLIMFLASK
ncbi:zinc finger TRAF-type-containing protein 1 homolog isoform X1 [Plodia interpunctella]|uniref:zinc finger TRAF-type-containing protein 1 homolog isoform X1 n=1 Tax=Plodia interpunctella TaxID=58824 RepID=UPI002367C519|nr:zinc finger TRAF-type-containing protein 1 homolog isoform X1 [Plodia interpunctella]